jgi:cytochrome c biogenesis protein CcdA
MSEVEVGIAIAFTAGLLSFLSPCVLPLVPSYLTFVTGMSLEDLQEGVNRRATFVHSILFVLGFSTIFVLLGAAASFLGQFFRYYEVWIARIGGVIIILLGLHLAVCSGSRPSCARSASTSPTSPSATWARSAWASRSVPGGRRASGPSWARF